MALALKKDVFSVEPPSISLVSRVAICILFDAEPILLQLSSFVENEKNGLDIEMNYLEFMKSLHSKISWQLGKLPTDVSNREYLDLLHAWRGFAMVLNALELNYTTNSHTEREPGSFRAQRVPGFLTPWRHLYDAYKKVLEKTQSILGTKDFIEL